MRAKDLARNLREKGPLWTFADGPALRFRVQQLEPGVRPMMETDKSKASDEYVLKAAATCDACGKSASDSEIIQAIGAAHDVDSFLENIRPLIEHQADCLTFLEMEGDYFEPPRRTRKAKKQQSSKKGPKAAKAKSKRKTTKKKSVQKKISKKAAKKAKRKK